jgi:hypothetical protein
MDNNDQNLLMSLMYVLGKLRPRKYKYKEYIAIIVIVQFLPKNLIPVD